MNMDMVWRALCDEAREEAQNEPALASYLFSTILAHKSLEDALAFVLANKLRSNVLLDSQLLEMFSAVSPGCEPGEDSAGRHAGRDRSRSRVRQVPADHPILQRLQAVQAHRVANALWRQNRRPLALLLQSRISEIFHVDVHPGATVGQGVMLDHATGVVIGETAVVGNNVSILHGVTLGGTGVKDGDRHPKIGDGVVIGAGSPCLGTSPWGQTRKSEPVRWCFRIFHPTALRWASRRG